MPSGSDVLTRRGGVTVSAAATHQEAHEVEGEHGGHAAEGQPLQHRAADAGRVAVVFGLIRAVVLIAARVAASYHHGNDQGSEHAHCRILAENLTEKGEERAHRRKQVSAASV